MDRSNGEEEIKCKLTLGSAVFQEVKFNNFTSCNTCKNLHKPNKIFQTFSKICTEMIYRTWLHRFRSTQD